MKKKLPFEEAIGGKLQQAPTPDKEQSWQAMEELLEKKKKRRGAFYFKRYLGIAALLLVAGAAAWLLISKDNADNKTTALNKKETINTITSQKNNLQHEVKDSTESNSNTSITSENKNATGAGKATANNMDRSTTSITKNPVPTTNQKNDAIKYRPIKNKTARKEQLRSSVISPSAEQVDYVSKNKKDKKNIISKKKTPNLQITNANTDVTITSETTNNVKQVEVDGNNKITETDKKKTRVSL